MLQFPHLPIQNKKRQIGIFSGSFNPIHVGHTTLARYILEHTYVEEVWFVVSPQNPLKESNSLLDEQLRLQMVKLAIAHEANMESSDIEFQLGKPSYTTQTLRALSNRYPDCQFSLIMGEDNLVILDKWREPQTILDNYKLIVYPRHSNGKILQSSYPTITVVTAPLLPISSSQIRGMTPQQRTTSPWIQKEVLAFIEEHRLY